MENIIALIIYLSGCATGFFFLRKAQMPTAWCYLSWPVVAIGLFFAYDEWYEKKHPRV